MWKMANNKNIEGGAEELDKYLSTKKQQKMTCSSMLIYLPKLYKQHAEEHFKTQTQGRTTAIRSQFPGGRTVSLYFGNE
jgi:hypothetical protein